jgi:hypothetical protein
MCELCGSAMPPPPLPAPTKTPVASAKPVTPATVDVTLPSPAPLARASSRSLADGYRSPFNELTEIIILHDHVGAPIPSMRDGSTLYDAVVHEVLDVAGYGADAVATTWRHLGRPR